MLKNPIKKEISILERIGIIKNGDSNERERLIMDYKPFIINIISKEIGRFVADGDCDELSIGLIAFNEAIDKFDVKISNSFFSFAERVIKNRLIDFFRKENKGVNTVPISYLNEFYDDDELEEKLFVDNSYIDEQDSSEEMEDFIKSLNSFGITLNELVESSPKHIDTRKNAVKIATEIIKNEVILQKVVHNKKLPAADIEGFLNVSRKVLRKNEKFIIAVCLILKSNNDIIKGYVYNLLKEVN